MTKTHFSHPGGILKRLFLDEYGLTVSAAARAMGLARSRLNDIVLERRDITAETALCLGAFFKNGAPFWLNLQTRYNLARAEIKAKAKIKKIVPFDETASQI